MTECSCSLFSLPDAVYFPSRPASRRKPEHEPPANTDEAQKKFGNVKAISSDMYFGRQDQADVSGIQ